MHYEQFTILIKAETPEELSEKATEAYRWAMDNAEEFDYEIVNSTSWSD